MSAKKNVLILGATGNIGHRIVELLQKRDDVQLTLLVRRPRAAKSGEVRVIEGDVLDRAALERVVEGQDVVFAGLSGDLEQMAKNIVGAMDKQHVKRLIFICSIGIYDEPVKSVLRPYRKAADAIEGSKLDYTILRPTWFTNADEVDYEVTKKGQPERGSIVSQKSVATLVARIIEKPEQYVRESIGVNKPGS